MQVRQVMTKEAEFVGPDVSVRTAAQKMRDRQIGALPVVKEDRVIGILTDRDIAIKVVPELEIAEEASVDRITVDRIMNSNVLHCYEDQDIEEVIAIMGDNQVRRLPVLDRQNRLVGIISIGDIAEDVSEVLAGEVLGEIVEKR